MLNQNHQFHSPWIHLNVSAHAIRQLFWRAVMITAALIIAAILLAISAPRVASG